MTKFYFLHKSHTNTQHKRVWRSGDHTLRERERERERGCRVPGGEDGGTSLWPRLPGHVWDNSQQQREDSYRGTRSYRRPDDIGACSLPSDKTHGQCYFVCNQKQILTSTLRLRQTWERQKLYTWNVTGVNKHKEDIQVLQWFCHYPFLHLQLWSVSIAFLPLQWENTHTHTHIGWGHEDKTYFYLINSRPTHLIVLLSQWLHLTCVAFSSCSFKSASSRSVSRNWAFNFSFSAKICS